MQEQSVDTSLFTAGNWCLENTTAHNRTQQNTTEHNRTQLNTTEENRIQQNTTVYNWTQQNTTEHDRTQQNPSDGADSDRLPKTTLRYKRNDDANYSDEDIKCLSPMGRYEWDKRSRDGSKVCSLLSNSSQISLTHCFTLHFLRCIWTPTPRKTAYR